MFWYKYTIFIDNNASFKNQLPVLTFYLQGSSVCIIFMFYMS